MNYIKLFYLFLIYLNQLKNINLPLTLSKTPVFQTFDIDCNSTIQKSNNFLKTQSNLSSGDCQLIVSPDYEQLHSLYETYVTILEVFTATTSKTISVQLSLIDQVYFYSPKVVNENTHSSIKIYANDRHQHVFDSLRGLQFQLNFEFTNTSYFFNKSFHDYIYIDHGEYKEDKGKENSISLNHEFFKFKSLKFTKFNLILSYDQLTYSDYLVIKKNFRLAYPYDMKVLPLTNFPLYLLSEQTQYQNISISSTNYKFKLDKYNITAASTIDESTNLLIEDKDQVYEGVHTLSYNMKVTTVQPVNIKAILNDGDIEYKSNRNNIIHVSYNAQQLKLNFILNDIMNDAIWTNKQLYMKLEVMINDIWVKLTDYNNETIDIDNNVTKIKVKFDRNKNITSFKNDYTLEPNVLEEIFIIQKFYEISIDILETNLVNKYKKDIYTHQYNPEGYYFIIPLQSYLDFTISNGSNEYTTTWINKSLDSEDVNIAEHVSMSQVDLNAQKYTMRLHSKMMAELLVTVCDINLKRTDNSANCLAFGVQFKGSANNVSSVGYPLMDSYIFEVLDKNYIGIRVKNSLNDSYSFCPQFANLSKLTTENQEYSQQTLVSKTMWIVDEFKSNMDTQTNYEYSLDSINNFRESCMVIKVDCLNYDYDDEYNSLQFNFNNLYEMSLRIKCIYPMNIESYNTNLLLLVPEDRHEVKIYGGPGSNLISTYQTKVEWNLIRRGDDYLRHQLLNANREKEYQTIQDKLDYVNEFVSIKHIDEHESEIMVNCKQFGTYQLSFYKYTHNPTIKHTGNKYILRIDLRCELPTDFAYSYYNKLVYNNSENLKEVTHVYADRVPGEFSIMYLNYQKLVFDTVNFFDLNFLCYRLDQSTIANLVRKGIQYSSNLSEMETLNMSSKLIEKCVYKLTESIYQNNPNVSLPNQFLMKVETSMMFMAKFEYFIDYMKLYSRTSQPETIRGNFYINFVESNIVEPQYQIYHMYLIDAITLKLKNINSKTEIYFEDFSLDNFPDIFSYKYNKDDNTLTINTNAKASQVRNCEIEKHIFSITIKNKHLVNMKDIILLFNIVIPTELLVQAVQKTYFVTDFQLPSEVKLCDEWNRCLIPISKEYTNMSLDTSGYEEIDAHLDLNIWQISYQGDEYLKNKELIFRYTNKMAYLEQKVRAVYCPAMSLKYYLDYANILPNSDTFFELKYLEYVGNENLQVTCTSSNLLDSVIYVKGGCKLITNDYMLNNYLTVDVEFANTNEFHALDHYISNLQYNTIKPSQIILNKPNYFEPHKSYVLTYQMLANDNQEFYPSVSNRISVKAFHDTELDINYETYNMWMVMYSSKVGVYQLNLQIIFEDVNIASGKFEIECLDKNKLKRDLPSLNLVYGVMLNSKFYFDEQVDLDNIEEVHKNDGYVTENNMVISPAILNRELIISSHNSLLRIRTLEPKYLFFVDNSSLMATESAYNYDNLKYVSSSTIQKGKEYSYDIIILDQLGVRFLTNQVVRSNQVQFYLSNSKAAQVTIRKDLSFQLQIKNSGTFMLTIIFNFTNSKGKNTVLTYSHKFNSFDDELNHKPIYILKGGFLDIQRYQAYMEEIQKYVIENKENILLSNSSKLSFLKSQNYLIPLKQGISINVIATDDFSILHKIDYKDIRNQIIRLNLDFIIKNTKVYNDMYAYKNNDEVSHNFEFKCTSSDSNIRKLTSRGEDEFCIIELYESNYIRNIKVDVDVKLIYLHQVIKHSISIDLLNMQDLHHNFTTNINHDKNVRDTEIFYSSLLILFTILAAGVVVIFVFPSILNWKNDYRVEAAMADDYTRLDLSKYD